MVRGSDGWEPGQDAGPFRWSQPWRTAQVTGIYRGHASKMAMGLLQDLRRMGHHIAFIGLAEFYPWRGFQQLADDPAGFMPALNKRFPLVHQGV